MQTLEQPNHQLQSMSSAEASASSLDYIITFLTAIGIQASYGSVPQSSFIPNIRINAGGLVLNRDCHPSGLLHEAGHLAITPKRYRHLMSGDISKGIANMIDLFDKEQAEPDCPLYRAVVQCSDHEATAWAYAAGIHLGLLPSEIIQDHEYDGEGADIRAGLALNQYVGINGLAFAGFCSVRGIGPLPRYPNLKYWTQEL